ncbi:TonB-dependent receptor [Ancylobacter dichloromethanicus]|uniref:Iron transport outer membrane receptor n=1 Tax=Ancylobacter dichloromethanicus TaxID=518825 RepID=A0A9W6J7S3_9HYPH|nr:TonB-dependent siderophore receptor [Ancylobacter dichloromethanicus]GLK70949.1 iron transport outer membrane receptor [Ancylobacter dichloromethanicus]
MKTLRTLRDTSPNAAWTAGLAVTMSALPMFAAQAQQAATPATGEELPTVTVEGENAQANTLEATTGISRLPGRVQDIPQTVQVITQQTMQEQGVTTLEQALRNVPGVTVGIGEGGGGMNGDQFRIRGFQSKGDVYINGLRDFGVYVRDSFAYESVEVLKGPSSESFGAGTTGGAINSTLKQAHLGDKTDIEGQFGTGPLYRGVFDINKQLDETTALRVVGMVNEQDVADRDHVESNRYGIMADLGFGLGTDQTLHLNYLYQNGSRTPDYGVPIVTPKYGDVARYGSLGKPVTEWGVPRSTFYGKVTDHDDTEANMFTANFRREVNDWLTITNDSRVGYYTRNFATTVPGCSNGGARGQEPTEAQYDGSCVHEFLNGGNPDISFGGGNPGFDQTSWSGQNVTTAIAKFNTGFLRHEVVAGIDMYIVDDERTLISVAGDKGTSTIRNPIYANTTGYFLYANPLGNNGQRESTATDFGAFVSDRIWLTEQLSILGGIRYDSYSADYSFWCVGATCANGSDSWTNAESTTQFSSPKASVIWEPTANQTYYASWARSYSPQGMFPTNDITVVNPTQNNLEPEENETYEIGFKVSTPDGRLGFTGSLFRVDKSNAYYVDPITFDTVETGENQRVQGVELGMTGNITRAWTIQAAYAYYDSEIQTSTTASYIGNDVPFVSENNFTLWTTYELTQDVLTQVPGKLMIGGGITYASEYYTNSANTAIIPETFSLDALISYEYENYRIALNAYNLTDELNYAAGWGNRAVPSAGRTFTLTVGATF